jgi:hypothetical protein
MGAYNDAITGTCDKITFASTGKSTRFGDLSTVHMGSGGASNSVKGFQLGGQIVADGAASNIIDSIVIAHGGTSLDFGDLTRTAGGKAAASSGEHGGLTDGY